MSEACTAYGRTAHKYAVGTKFNFDGGIEIVSQFNETDGLGNLLYEVRMPDGKIQLVEEEWIDAGRFHFGDGEYAVSFIASAPEELKVGDRVEVVDASDEIEKKFLYRQGRVANPTTPDGCNPYPDKIWVDFNGERIFYFYPDQLRKLPDTSNPMDRQVGGSHYKKCKIEPAEYIHANGLDFFQGNVVKYITRFRDKDGKADLEKIKHYCDMLIQMEYPED